MDARARHRRGLLLAATGIFIISPDGLLFRLAGNVDLWDAVFVRTLAMGVGLGVFLLARHRGRLGPLAARFGWPGLACAGIVAASNVAFIGAFSHTTIANTLLILAAMPLFSAVIARVFIAEAIRASTWAAILVAIAGVTVIVGGGHALGQGGGSLAGDAMAVAASLLIAANLVVLRRYPHVDGVVVLCLAGFMAAAVAWPFAAPSDLPLRSVAILVLLGGLIVPLALALMFRGTHYLPAAEVALFSLIETVLGPLWAWLGVGEAPGIWALAGGAVVVAAIAANAAYGMHRAGQGWARSPVPKSVRRF